MVVRLCPPSSRLSGDVQDLKSSFKLVVSHGLRSLTQTIGCVTSLFFISPQMTGTVGVALPVMIAVGTLFGSVLRKWSRQSQEQVQHVTVGECDVHAYLILTLMHAIPNYHGGWTFRLYVSISLHASVL